jgi:hypothetical protein
VIATTTKRELSEVKLKLLDTPFEDHISIHSRITMVFFKPYFFHATEVKTSLVLKS